VRTRLGRRWHQLRGHYVDRFAAIQRCIRSLEHVARFVEDKGWQVNGAVEKRGPRLGERDWVAMTGAHTTKKQRANWSVQDWIRRLTAERVKERIGECDTVVERRGVVLHRRWSWDEMEEQTQAQDVGVVEIQAPVCVSGKRLGEGESEAADEVDDEEGTESGCTDDSDKEAGEDSCSEGQSESDDTASAEEEEEEQDSEDDDSEDEEEQPSRKKARHARVG
jgi:hypothetical protein